MPGWHCKYLLLVVCSSPTEPPTADGVWDAGAPPLERAASVLVLLGLKLFEVNNW